MSFTLLEKLFPKLYGVERGGGRGGGGYIGGEGDAKRSYVRMQSQISIYPPRRIRHIPYLIPCRISCDTLYRTIRLGIRTVYRTFVIHPARYRDITYRAIHHGIYKIRCKQNHARKTMLPLDSRRLVKLGDKISTYRMRCRARSCDTIHRISDRYRQFSNSRYWL